MEESVVREKREGEKPAMPEREARQYSPLTLAFMGDAVYEQILRERIVRSGPMPPHVLNKKTSALAKAATQAQLARLLRDELTQEEEAVLIRGRNAHSYTMAKNASMADYRLATGWEALLGYLYLSGQTERVAELVERGLVLLPEEYFKKERNG